MRNSKKLIGISLVIVALLFVGMFVFRQKKEEDANRPAEDIRGLTTVYVAAGGGKEGYLADEDILKILHDKYKLNPVYDNWSNGKTIVQPLIREQVKLGNNDIVNRIAKGETYSITSDGVSKYDALFTSDQRFYDYYKLSPKDDEAARYYVADGGLMLNTPVVMYSWKEVVDPLIKQGIVEERDGVYYIVDMAGLMNIISDGKSWKDIGLDLYGKINIRSTDPVTSSPGATYYGLLYQILANEGLSGQELWDRLYNYYQNSGYMNNTPADLFDRYLKTGVGGEPIIVDYEKSLINFINTNPEGFAQVKDKLVVLYPEPTIWNSHCFAAFTDNGKLLYEALQDEEISQIAWERYGFRTGVAESDYDVSKLGITVPKEIRQTVQSLKMDDYNKLIETLKQ